MAQNTPSVDQATADKFATSWNNVYHPSVYTADQVRDWIAPLSEDDIEGKTVLELGCGSGALMIHLADMRPARLVGIDLGNCVDTALALVGPHGAEVVKGDLTEYEQLKKSLGLFDVVYCIGVLHHLSDPERGVASLVELTRPGGRFHGWVYAHEGNAVVRYFVDPLRRVVNHLPWWFTKYACALPLALPVFAYGRLCRLLAATGTRLPLPLFEYMLWISKRTFAFHHHVVFDQLVTPMTHYIRKARVEKWLSDPRIEAESSYILFRNGNGWKFGGRIRAEGCQK